MIYHSEPLTTRLILSVNSDIKDPDIREAVEKGASYDATCLERTTYFLFGTSVLRKISRVPSMVAMGVLAIQWLIDPFAIPVISFLFIFVVTLLTTLTTDFAGKRRENQNGDLADFTGEDLLSSVGKALAMAIAWTAFLYYMGMCTAYPRHGGEPFHGLFPNSGLFGT